MRKLLLFLSLHLICSFAFSQSTVNKPTSKSKIGENSVIIDELGNQYSYAQWKAIEAKNNHYLIRRNENDKDIFLIKAYTSEEEKAERMLAISKPKPSPAFTEGEKFKYFDLKTLDGIKLKKEDLSGKILVFNFWFINCPPCRREMPELNTLTEKYKDQKDVLFLGIALDEVSNLKEFLKKEAFYYTQVRGGRVISTQQNIKAFPTHVIVNKDGHITFSAQGLKSNTVFWIDKTIKEAL